MNAIVLSSSYSTKFNGFVVALCAASKAWGFGICPTATQTVANIVAKYGNARHTVNVLFYSTFFVWKW